MADDLVDRLLGIAPGSPPDLVRAARPQARSNAQRSYEVLLEPADPAGVPRPIRLLVAAYVAGLHRAVPLTVHYSRLATAETGAEAVRIVADLVEHSRTAGPYGRYHETGLAAESTDGPRHRVPDTDRERLGEATAAALDHAHLLVFRPREAGPDDQRALEAAGWSTTGIVTLSQIIAFLTFQIRLVHGLEVLFRRPAEVAP